MIIGSLFLTVLGVSRPRCPDAPGASLPTAFLVIWERLTGGGESCEDRFCRSAAWPACSTRPIVSGTSQGPT